MGTVIIFDGADKVGKTEISKELSKVIDIPYFKNKSEWDAFSKEPSYFLNSLRYGAPYFLNFLKDTGTSVILDRAYPSEWVYSKVYGRPTDEKMLSYLDELASSFDVKIIIPYRTNYEGLRDDVHDIDECHLQKISDTYGDFVKWTKCDVLHLCVDSEDLEWEIKSILEFLKEKTT